MASLGIACFTDLIAGTTWLASGPTIAAELGLELGTAVMTRRQALSSLVLVIDRYQAPILAGYAAWLRTCTRALVLVDDLPKKHASAPNEALDEGVIRAAFAFPLEILRLDGSPESRDRARAAIAMFAASALPASPNALEARARKTAPPGAGPWISVQSARPDAFPELEINGGLCLRDGNSTYYATPAGRFIDLLTGESELVGIPFDQPRAVSADGTSVLLRDDEGQLVIRDVATGSPRSAMPGTHQLPVTFDAGCGLGAAGWRAHLDWIACAVEGPQRFGAVTHAWPEGHARKLYGYRDNHPRSLVVTPDGAGLSIFDVDAVVFSTAPFTWRQAGPYALLEHPPAENVPTLFFCPDWTWAGGHPDLESALEEDVRGAPPGIAIGPDAAHRYAVDFSSEVWSIRNGVAEHLGGPESVFVTYSADHRPVRRSSGRLLSGDGIDAVVLDAGQVFREDMRTGARRRVCDEIESVSGAIALPGSDLVVLYRKHAGWMSIRKV